MSKFLERDDHRINRLSSFLYWEGNLETKKVHPIKRNIYYIETTSGDAYVLKGHSNMNNVQQQWEFFNRIQSNHIVPFTKFPNGKKEITAGTKYSWTISPYISGRKLNYKSPVDRNRAVSTIKKFHYQASGIYVNHFIRKQLFFTRWDARQEKFLSTEEIFEKLGFMKLFQDMNILMKKYIHVVSSYDWKKEQLEAERKGCWVHGDVASHNYLLKNEQTYLIDFDLLHCTSQLYDVIQLGQRFLPNIDWDVNTLLQYNMVKEEEIERFLYSVFIPSDMVREWLHFLTKKRRITVHSYLEIMENEWIKRKEFLKESIKLIK
ncbi:phosphotransferase [Ornithinibacillus halotolerans]|uniref:Spore coat protein n=1 Tax=Ornithinibacillus halotolerans TaxID=1274357 RepID=A0A916RSN6_9BACI|nr:phosphotransferase [Ornithinibacillus halotolerans]GGA69291.1 spore coat protein [Ornithinibacillus halotolerans]